MKVKRTQSTLTQNRNTDGGEIEAEEWIVATKVIADGLKELTHTEDLDMSKYHGADDSGDGKLWLGK